MAKRKTTARKKTTARRAPAKGKARRTTARAAKPAKARRAPAKRAAAKARPAAAAAARVTPYLCCKGAVAALDFYRDAFGAIETLRIAGQDGSIGHAEVEIAGCPVMISDEWAEGGVFSPPTLGGTAVAIHLYVPDVDAFVAQALGAGAAELRPVTDQPYGDRSATIRDPFGHRWMISTPVREMSKAEMERAFGGAYKVS